MLCRTFDDETMTELNTDDVEGKDVARSRRVSEANNLI